jgi:two-component system chemotaxis response regulator CheB
MWQLNAGALARYRCHIGHAYGEEQLVVCRDDNLKCAMASALRST